MGAAFVVRKLCGAFGVVAATLLLVACGSDRPVGQAPNLSVVDLSTLPVPSAKDDMANTGQADTVQPLDQLAISTFGVPDLTRQVKVGPRGSFAFPLIGKVQATDRTPAEIARDIQDRLKNGFVNHPDVTVEIDKRADQYITVGGEVRSPGQYPIHGTLTLMQAVAIGGGRTDYSKLSQVLIFRTVAGRHYIGVYDLKAIQKGNYADPKVYPNDTIMVGDSPGRRLIASVLTYVQLIANPLILADRVARGY